MNTGYIQSVMDGTEHVASWDVFEIPDTFSYRKLMPPVKDQGDSFLCVGYSLCSVMDVLTNMDKGVSRVDNNYSPEEIYEQRSNKSLNGMAPKDALRYLRHHGLFGHKIANYARIMSVTQAKLCLLMSAPFILGLRVYNNSSAFWKPMGRMKGGHCVTCTGYTPDGFEIRNSWGSTWANGGYTILPYDDWDKVLEAWTVTL